jgi:nitric oxide reductase subunit B
VKRLWIMLAIVMLFGFTVLGWIGSRIYQYMPPIPERIVTTDGRIVVPDGAIRRGQAVWTTSPVEIWPSRCRDDGNVLGA